MYFPVKRITSAMPRYLPKFVLEKHTRPWKFYVVDSAPVAAVLGMDAILSWPLFFSPLDCRIFILPELFNSHRIAGTLGGTYEYWHDRDMHARARCLTRRACEDPLGNEIPVL